MNFKVKQETKFSFFGGSVFLNMLYLIAEHHKIMPQLNNPIVIKWNSKVSSLIFALQKEKAKQFVSILKSWVIIQSYKSLHIVWTTS